jgi:hypothetical protein
MRCTVDETRSSTSGDMADVDSPLRMPSIVTFSVGGSQRLNGPQPSKKGRTPGPAGEGKGAVVYVLADVKFEMIVCDGRECVVGGVI